MAVVVIGGMLSSTVLTVLVVPALYTMFDDLQAWFGRVRVHPLPVPAFLAKIPGRSTNTPAVALAVAGPNGHHVGDNGVDGTNHRGHVNGHADSHVNGHVDGHLDTGVARGAP
jgi:hypothetical protein